MRNRRVRIALALAASLAIAGGAYASIPASTVPPSGAVGGAGTVSGYTITNIHYGLDVASPVEIDSLTFTVSPTIPSSGSGGVLVQATLSTGGPATYSCATNANGDLVTCATTSPPLTVALLTAITVVASQ
jgi:hypothetical protein